jgi:NADH dehydrogenase [ubiquinone] 1 alpha subcomplex assembly factor 7
MRDEAADTLGAILRRLIATTGPISVQYYMGESNARYYASRDPLGDAGDFVTAPEISQMFGEMVGLWLADMWMRAGTPEPVHYVELGPGRGTLARDVLRSARKFGLEPQVHFVETSPALKALQVDAVANAVWHDDLSTVPVNGPVLVVGNEFLDALPIRQLVKTTQGWRERMVAVHEDALVGLAGERPMDAAVPPDLRDAEPGTLIELCPGAASVVYEIAGRLAEQGGAALFIDYGHDAARTGSTLQAVRAHQKVDAFMHPGDADLTAHVDFATLANVALSRGCRWLGTVEQGAWLRALGIESRAQSLAQLAPQHADALAAALERLVGDEQMGTLFKVMGLAAPNWPNGAGF